jgi:hypothetical protein
MYFWLDPFGSYYNVVENLQDSESSSTGGLRSYVAKQPCHSHPALYTNVLQFRSATDKELLI